MISLKFRIAQFKVAIDRYPNLPTWLSRSATENVLRGSVSGGLAWMLHCESRSDTPTWLSRHITSLHMSNDEQKLNRRSFLQYSAAISATTAGIACIAHKTDALARPPLNSARPDDRGGSPYPYQNGPGG
jgi:hypothetical protein